MRATTFVLLFALVISAHAGDAPPAETTTTPPAETPINSWQWPDLATTRTRFATSPYAKIWALPALVATRKQLETWAAQFEKDHGIDPLALLNDAAYARVQTVAIGFGADALMVRGEVRLATRANGTWRALEQISKPVDRTVTIQELSFRRAGESLLIAKGGATPTPIAEKPLAADWADQEYRFDVRAFISALEAPPEALKASELLGLSTLRYDSAFTAQGSRDLLDLGEMDLPLAPVDQSALAALPEKPLLLLAAGIDGTKLDLKIAAFARAFPEFSKELKQADAELAKEKLPAITDLLRGLNGTAYLAIINRAPFPGVTMALPASPSLDAVVNALGTKNGVDLSTATTDAVMIPLPQTPMPVSLMVRRTATHWVLSTDLQTLDAIGAGTPGGFALATLGKSIPEAAKPVQVVVFQNTRELVQLALNFVPMAAGQIREPEQKAMLAQVQRALAAALPLVPSALMVSPVQRRLVLVGENGQLVAAPQVCLAAVLLPAVDMVRTRARRTKSVSHMRQILITCVAWANDNDQAWPNDLPTLRKELGDELDEKVFNSPSNPRIADPYLYVRPVPNVTPPQPVLIEDPACNKNKGTNVCYADGHTEFIEGVRALELWKKAQELAVSDAAKKDGVTGEAWGDLLGK